MKKLVIFCYFFLSVAIISYAQTQEAQRMALMKDFLHEIFYKPVTKATLEDFGNRYIYIDTETKNEYTPVQRMGVAAYLAEYYYKTYKDIYDEKKVAIIPYTQLQKMTKVVNFSPVLHKDIYCVQLDNNVMMYILFKDIKIASFFYMKDHYPDNPDWYAIFLAF